ncbi:hypothetical protein Adt_37145 [Abeliophyllum distichum]|uniref:Uncharacterized protein n=1 Tax=Abeliophyllum distichum TaxID=126358 RepID=A0ABD1QN93_9LAMI
MAEMAKAWATPCSHATALSAWHGPMPNMQCSDAVLAGSRRHSATNLERGHEIQTVHGMNKFPACNLSPRAVVTGIRHMAAVCHVHVVFYHDLAVGWHVLVVFSTTLGGKFESCKPKSWGCQLHEFIYSGGLCDRQSALLLSLRILRVSFIEAIKVGCLPVNTVFCIHPIHSFVAFAVP